MWFGPAVRAGIADPTSGSAHISVEVCVASIAAVQWIIQTASYCRKERLQWYEHIDGRPRMILARIGMGCFQCRARRGLSVWDAQKLDQFSLKYQECDQSLGLSHIALSCWGHLGEATESAGKGGRHHTRHHAGVENVDHGLDKNT